LLPFHFPFLSFLLPFRLLRSCNGAQSKAMLAVTVLVLAVAAVALFARDWRFGAHGPGIMTKIKIFITHFQVGTAQRSMPCTRVAHQGGLFDLLPASQRSCPAAGLPHCNICAMPACYCLR
jgi:hypothetical protein